VIQVEGRFTLPFPIRNYPVPSFFILRCEIYACSAAALTMVWPVQAAFCELNSQGGFREPNTHG
jgi:hypothetical protein